MRLALFLHLYQPSTQFSEILHKVVRESYEPIIQILEANPTSLINLNMSGALVEQLAQGHDDLLYRIFRLVARHQVELTGSACYHPLLPYIPDAEVARQVRINEQATKKNYGAIAFGPGFFPPEMAVDTRVCQEIKNLGYSYVTADELALSESEKGYLLQSRIFIDKNSGLKIICRHKELSLAIAFSKLRNISDFIESVSGQPYVILAMDGETFGHHRPEQMELLRSILQYHVISNKLQLVRLSDLVLTEPAIEIDVQRSCWGESFARWDNPHNKLHPLQWKLLNTAIEAVGECSVRNEGYWQARCLLDQGLQSDQFWWASYDPCWHYKMVERGARLLKDAVENLPGDSQAKKEVCDLYDEITQTGLSLYGDCVIGC